MSSAPVRSAFTPSERRIIEAATTPGTVRCWLESLPYNHEEGSETLRTFRGLVRADKVHCPEAALGAATILEQHGYPPIVVDLGSQDNLDHVVFLLRDGSAYSTVVRSRDPELRGRKPMFRSARDLAYSYVNPFVDLTGRINGYGVIDLRTLRADWRLSMRNMWAVEHVLIRMPIAATRPRMNGTDGGMRSTDATRSGSRTGGPCSTRVATGSCSPPRSRGS